MWAIGAARRSMDTRTFARIYAGHIYSVMTYMWMFAMSLDDGPSLLGKYAQLKEIGKRVNTGLV